MIHENKRIIKNKLVLSQYEILKESYNHAIENFHVLYKGESMNKEALHNFVLKFRKEYTTKNTNIYVTQDDIFIKTIFSYENIKNNECIPISKEQYSIKYADAKNNEFFITSEKGIKAMEKYKQSLIQKYNYN